MASIYNKNGIIYISWWEAGLRKVKNRSTGLKYSRDNIRKARKAAEKIDQQLLETSMILLAIARASTISWKTILINIRTLLRSITAFLRDLQKGFPLRAVVV